MQVVAFILCKQINTIWIECSAIGLKADEKKSISLDFLLGLVVIVINVHKSLRNLDNYGKSSVD